MSKFLNETGLSHFWEKVKEHLKGNYLNLSGGKLNDDATLETGNAERETATTISPDGLMVSHGGTGRGAYGDRFITLTDAEGNEFVASTEEVLLQKNTGSSTVMVASIQEIGIRANGFTKFGGTEDEVLMADGNTKILGGNNGVATLDANGKIPLDQLGNIDTTLFSVVAALPTKDIVKNRIYLVKSANEGDDNLYTEFIYTGDVAAAYDASKWEKLGEYSSEVDLSSYSKKAETVSSIDLKTRTADSVSIAATSAAGEVTGGVNLAKATQTEAGVMSASDKKVLDTLAARYPLSVSSFSVSPSLVQVGKEVDATFSWGFSNSDFHPIESQKISVDGGAEQTVAVNSKSYKQSNLAGLSTAGTKSATLKINDTLTKSVSITYHYPSFIGVMRADDAITEPNIRLLTNSVEWGKGKTSTITQNNQIIVYAYPAAYGDLTSIKDGNGFQGFAGYTKQTLSILGQTYNVYVQKLPATSSSTYTFA